MPIPSCPPVNRAGTLLGVIIVVFSAIGLTMHSDFYAGRRRKDFFFYYTNVSNLLVLLYYALIAPRLYASASLQKYIPHAEFAVAASITLTFCVFHTLLLPGLLSLLRSALANSPPSSGTEVGVLTFPLLLRAAMADRETAIQLCSHLLVHVLIPLLTVMRFILCSPGKKSLRPADAIAWLLIPGLYLAVIMHRARLGTPLAGTQSPYPYPFLDIRRLGAVRVLHCCSMILLWAFLLSLSAVALCMLYG